MQPWQPLLDLWFGDDADDVTRATRQAPLWWGKSSDTDALLTSRFGELAKAAAAGELAHWADNPAGRLALILLLDQLPRNLHRGTPAAFAQDARARELCLKGLSLGVDKGLSPLAPGSSSTCPWSMQSPGSSRPEAWPCSRRWPTRRRQALPSPPSRASPISPAAIR